MRFSTPPGSTNGTAWDGLYPRPGHREVWAEHPGELPIIAGTLIQLQVERLPGDHDPTPALLAEREPDWTAFQRRAKRRAWRPRRRRGDPHHPRPPA